MPLLKASLNESHRQKIRQNAGSHIVHQVSYQKGFEIFHLFKILLSTF
jgi:hypothetical protein